MVREGYADGCAERLGEDDDAFGWDACGVHREVGERERVGQKTGFRRPSGTRAEPAVVYREDVDAGCGGRDTTIALWPPA